MIGKLYRWLFDAHRHEWEIIDKGELVRRSDGSLVGTIYTLRCKICGNIKQQRAGL